MNTRTEKTTTEEEKNPYLFAHIMLAREHIKRYGKAPSEATEKQYRATAMRLIAKGTNPAEHANTKRSFYTYRAAWTYFHTIHLKSLITESEKYKFSTDPEKFDKIRNQILRTIQILEEYKPDRQRENIKKQTEGGWVKAVARKKAATNDEFHEVRHSKKLAVKHLEDGWRTKLFAHALHVNSKYVDVIALLSVSGCRPAEIQNGVTIEVVPENKSLRVTIAGAKRHGGKYGAKKRSFEVTAEECAEWQHLFVRAVQAGGAMTLQAGAGDVSDAVRNLSAGVWKPGSKQAVSAYCFRHQFSADVKASGEDAETVAMLLGHCTDESQTFYAAGRGKGDGRKFSNVQSTTKPVMKNAARGYRLETMLGNRLVATMAAIPASEPQPVSIYESDGPGM